MSLAQVPVDDFLAITRYLTIKHGLDFEPSEDDGLYYTDCTNEQYDKLPDLEISLHKGKGSPESKTVKIPKSRYMIQSQFLSHNYVFGLQPQTNTPLGTKGNTIRTTSGIVIGENTNVAFNFLNSLDEGRKYDKKFKALVIK